KRMKFLYNKMSKDQKNSAERFPNVVPLPPPAPDAPNTKQNSDNEPQKTLPQTKTEEMVMLNGKKSTDGIFTLTIDELKDAKLTIQKGTIDNFKFKVPGKPTVSIQGNTLNEEAKSLLKELPSGHAVQL